MRYIFLDKTLSRTKLKFEVNVKDCVFRTYPQFLDTQFKLSYVVFGFIYEPITFKINKMWYFRDDITVSYEKGSGEKKQQICILYI